MYCSIQAKCNYSTGKMGAGVPFYCDIRPVFIVSSRDVTDLHSSSHRALLRNSLGILVIVLNIHKIAHISPSDQCYVVRVR